MSSGNETNAEEIVQKPVADSGKPMGDAVATASKSKLPLLIGLLVLGVAAIYGGRTWLEAQKPKSGGEFVREKVDVAPGLAGLPGIGGGGAGTPAGVKPPIAAAAEEERLAEIEASESEDKKEDEDE